MYLYCSREINALGYVFLQLKKGAYQQDGRQVQKC